MDDRQKELGWQQRAIDRARSGDEESAWIVVRAIILELDSRYHDVQCLKRFFDFVEALLDSKDAAVHRSPKRDQLGAALGRLGITRVRGERRVDESAWEELSAALHILQVDESPVLRHGATLVEALLSIKNLAPNAAPKRRELVAALDVLNILPNPWRPATGYRELLGRIAAEKLEVLKGKSVAEARASLQTGQHRLSESRQGDICTENSDLIDLVEGASRKELEGLAKNLLPRE